MGKSRLNRTIEKQIVDISQLLTRVLERVKTLDPVHTRKWFDDLKAISLDNGVFKIGCPEQSWAQYLQENCLATFTYAVQAATGYLVSVQFVPLDGAPIPASLPAAPYALRLNPDYTFDSFVVGPCNRLAHASCVAVSQSPGVVYNPLFLYGNVGLGKTHLLHAVCHETRRQFPNAAILFLSCEQFVNGFISAIEQGTLAEFQNQFRSVDMLIIDDVQFLREREHSQEEFFHTFNALYNSRKQIILTADSAPQDLASLQERLVSRFKWGLVARLDPPSYETRIAIIKKKAHLRGLSLTEDVAELVAEHIKTNIRELEGALTMIYASARAANVPITLELAKQALGVCTFPSSPSLSMPQIVKSVCEEFSVRLADVQGKRRSQNVALPRQVCMYLARQLTEHSLEEIGGHLGGRDHSTVLHACAKIEQMLQTDPAFREKVEKIKHGLLHAPR